MVKVVYFVLPLLVGLSLQASTPSSPTYEAGVVEFNYKSETNVSPEDSLKGSLAEYLEIMDSNASEDLDIIVFPEMTLNGMETAVETPDPADTISPCHDSTYPDDLVKKISCSADTHKRYVVVNAVTKAKCPDPEMVANNDPRNCSKRDDGFSYYNTNLVFDRNGTLVSRYRKFNLFGEEVDRPFKPSMVTFDTDFGVKFGHFICFDLMFRYPALELVKGLNVTDIVFPTMWFSELPFLTGAQVQKGWAFSNNVNLLAAGANNPDRGSTGTGIYAGKIGTLQSVMEGSSKSQLYRTTVPKRDHAIHVSIVENKDIHNYSPQEMAPLVLKRDQLDRYNISFLKDDELSGEVKHCFNDLCCTFNYNYTVNTTSQTPHYRYALAVYHGSRTFDGFADGGVVTCAVIACQSEEIATCGVRNESFAYAHDWNKLEISGVFSSDNQFFYLPSSLTSSVMPLGVDQFEYTDIWIFINGNSEYKITLNTKGIVKDLYAFGIYGRDFNLDAFPADEPDAAGALGVSFMFVMLMAVILTLKNVSM